MEQKSRKDKQFNKKMIVKASISNSSQHQKAKIKKAAAQKKARKANTIALKAETAKRDKIEQMEG